MKISKKGFTLIELLVVIAIISILTGIVISNLSQPKAKARDAKRVSDLAQLQLALELYFDRCGAYPKTLATGETTAGCSGITFGTFIAQIPNMPLPLADASYANYSDGYWVNPTASADPSDYVLKTKLEANNSVLQDSYTGTPPGGTYYKNGSTVTGFTSCPTINPNFEYCVVPR